MRKDVIASLLVLLMLAATGGYMIMNDGTDNDSPDNGDDNNEIGDEWDVYYVQSGDDLPTCGSTTLGRLYYVASAAGFETCTNVGWAFVNLTGPAGSTGLTGAEGANGAQGPAGVNGTDGADGAQGLDGTDGTDGANGVNGTDGDDGADGANGADGVNGTDGTDGADGADGANGADGLNGTGADGVNGVDGHDGTDGINGINGTDGQDGADGVDGLDGIDGINGINGTDGQDGADGVDGHSALARTSPESSGSNCADGGIKIEVGVDDNDDGVLQVSEVDQTNYVCNGADGQDGVNGTNGGASANSMLTSISAPSHAMCSGGGRIMQQGFDNGDGGGTAANGQLESGEIDYVMTLCTNMVVGLIADLDKSELGSHPTYLEAVGNTLYFRFDNGTNDYELWQFDTSTSTSTSNPSMVYDISRMNSGGDPRYIEAIGTTLYFQASDGTATGQHGTELWQFDTTSAASSTNPSMIYDIRNGTISSNPRYLKAVGTTLYFNAYDSNGQELWKFDTTSAASSSNPSMVYDIVSGAGSSNPLYLGSVGTTLYFNAIGGAVSGYELWQFDTTSTASSSNPSLVYDIIIGSDGSYPMYLESVGTTLYFQANDGTNGQELWQFDTTSTASSSNPSLVYNIWPGGHSYPTHLGAVGTTLYFQADDGRGYGRELWQFNTTSGASSGNPSMVQDFLIGVEGSEPNYPQAVGTSLYFVIEQSVGGGLWMLDTSAPSAISSELILPTPRTISFFDPQSSCLTEEVYGDKVYASTEHGLWQMDPASKSGIVVAHGMGGCHSEIIGDTMYHSVYFDGIGYELWKYNFTNGAEELVYDINSGSGDSAPEYLESVGTTLYFQADDGGGQQGRELWKFETTSTSSSSNPSMVYDIRYGSLDSNPNDLTAVGSTLYFQATDGTNGNELWQFDTTSAASSSNPSMVYDIWTYNNGSNPRYLESLGTTLYFQANDGTNGAELWQFDTTSAVSSSNPSMIYDIVSGSGSSNPEYLKIVGTTLYFNAADSTNGQELWQFDTSTSTSTSNPSMVYDIVSGSGGSNPNDLTVVGMTLYFRANDGTNGQELWQFDTSTSTSTSNPSMVYDISAGSGDSNPEYLEAVGTYLVFWAYHPSYGVEMWVCEPVTIVTYS